MKPLGLPVFAAGKMVAGGKQCTWSFALCSMFKYRCRRQCPSRLLIMSMTRRSAGRAVGGPADAFEQKRYDHYRQLQCYHEHFKVGKGEASNVERVYIPGAYISHAGDLSIVNLTNPPCEAQSQLKLMIGVKHVHELSGALKKSIW